MWRTFLTSSYLKVSNTDDLLRINFKFHLQRKINYDIFYAVYVGNWELSVYCFFEVRYAPDIREIVITEVA